MTAIRRVAINWRAADQDTPGRSFRNADSTAPTEASSTVRRCSNKSDFNAALPSFRSSVVQFFENSSSQETQALLWLLLEAEPAFNDIRRITSSFPGPCGRTMNSIPDSGQFESLISHLRGLSEPDSPQQWPESQFAALAAAGGWRWNIPVQYGGLGVDSKEMLQVYRELASAALVTTFILTQRNAACQRIELSPNSEIRSHLLSQLAEGTIFATVGISHLTTSRQHVPTPAVTARAVSQPEGFVLNGVVPWATGAYHADVLVTGGTLDDGRQILTAVPTDRLGVQVQPAVDLMGMSASQTGAVVLDDVFVASQEILHGPILQVMSHGAGGGAGSLGTSALALGAAQGTIRCLSDEVVRRPNIAEFVHPLETEAAQLANELMLAAQGQHPAQSGAVESIRGRANLLVTRSAQIWLATTKGAGYVSGHPAERAVRESMFFWVWSCPQPVLDANLRELACATTSTLFPNRNSPQL